MKHTLSSYQFRDAFMECRPNNFSSKGLLALWDYFEQYEDDTGEELELDVIAICCDFQEFKNLEDFQEQYSYDYDDMDSIEQETQVIYLGEVDGSDGFIIQQF